MKIRGLNKKGQEAVSNFGVTGIVLVVFMVVLILGIWFFNSKWSDLTGHVPENAAIIAKACSLVSRESELNSYCFQVREADKNVYTTCDYARNLNIVILDSEGSNQSTARMNKLCEQYPNELNGSIVYFCEKQTFPDRVKVNGKKCSDWIPKLDATETSTPGESE